MVQSTTNKLDFERTHAGNNGTQTHSLEIFILLTITCNTHGVFSQLLTHKFNATRKLSAM